MLLGLTLIGSAQIRFVERSLRPWTTTSAAPEPQEDHAPQQQQPAAADPGGLAAFTGPKRPLVDEASGRCVGVRPRDIDLLLEYVCVDCEASTGRKSHWLPKPEEKAKEEKAAAAAAARDAPKRAGVGGVYPKVQLKLATPDDDESRALVARYEAAYAALRPR